MMKLATLPISRLPILSYMPNKVAGVFVNASNAFSADKPYSIALRRLGIKSAGLFKSAVERQNGTAAFSNAAALPGAISQCFKSSNPTMRKSFGSSTSMGKG